jgi:hypothetical protein
MVDKAGQIRRLRYLVDKAYIMLRERNTWHFFARHYRLLGILEREGV